jgi:predicted HicB family RNase H-like nuclease
MLTRMNKLSTLSGRISMRMPTELHKELLERAAKENVSINTLVNHYISQGLVRNGKSSQHNK